MTYFRIHSTDIAWKTQQPYGIFVAVWKLVESKTMNEEEIAEYWKQREYFEKVLPVPPYYKDGNPDKAVTWFKDTEQGKDIYNQMSGCENRSYEIFYQIENMKTIILF